MDRHPYIAGRDEREGRQFVRLAVVALAIWYGVLPLVVYLTGRHA